MNTLSTHLATHFRMSFDMLRQEIAACPDELWNRRLGGYVFWQQILHALTGCLFWTRTARDPFAEPFADRQVFPELDQDPRTVLGKAELEEFATRVAEQLERFLDHGDDAWLTEASPLYDKILNIDVVQMQIRHLQYHAGHCNAILREAGVPAVEWQEYLG
jgi:uncharacterized damage-inducible protein DinB